MEIYRGEEALGGLGGPPQDLQQQQQQKQQQQDLHHPLGFTTGKKKLKGAGAEKGGGSTRRRALGDISNNTVKAGGAGGGKGGALGSTRKGGLVFVDEAKPKVKVKTKKAVAVAVDVDDVFDTCNRVGRPESPAFDAGPNGVDVDAFLRKSRDSILRPKGNKEIKAATLEDDSPKLPAALASCALDGDDHLGLEDLGANAEDLDVDLDLDDLLLSDDDLLVGS